MKLLFGDIVVIEGDLIGVVVKSWARSSNGKEASSDVYVRSYNTIVTYPNSQVERYHVRHKELDEDDMEWQAMGLQED